MSGGFSLSRRTGLLSNVGISGWAGLWCASGRGSTPESFPVKLKRRLELGTCRGFRSPGDTIIGYDSGSSYRSMTIAFNRTRSTYLATDLVIAGSHWTRFRGLMATSAAAFPPGRGLWIKPSHGIHTFAMRFAIDAVYLDGERKVVHLEEELKPWRLAAVRIQAASVIEIPAGTIRQSKTAIGDQIDIILERPVGTEAA